MCGICGKLNFNSERVEQDLIQEMCHSMNHRGPDHQGIYCQENIGLGHRRLSILDLSETGHQPMKRGHLWLVFNGEIYNYLELRRELELPENCGPKFSNGEPKFSNGEPKFSNGEPKFSATHFCTQSDSEVILALYEKYGAECLRYLRGMFAFAIWDEKNHTLFLARDRVGKKPLYYYHNPQCFVFASCLRALLVDPSIPHTIQPLAIHHYLTYQYAPYPFTIWQGIYKLPPAHSLMIHADGKLEIRRYWNLHYQPKLAIHTPEDGQNLQQQIWDLLNESVQIRLRSDVPLGAFLSGGLDSSLVVALMTKLLGQQIKTFSIGFDLPEYNELAYARQVSQHCHTEHYEQVVTAKDALRILPELVRHYEEPYADSSAIPCYLVSSLAREHVKVVLSGDGGDETFAGYDRYYFGKITARLQKIFPRYMAKLAYQCLSSLPSLVSSFQLLSKAKRFLQGYSLPFPDSYAFWMSHFSNDMKNQLTTKEFKQNIQDYIQSNILSIPTLDMQEKSLLTLDSLSLTSSAYFAGDISDILDRLLSTDVALYLPNDLLAKMDVATMAHGLESRSPWLDHKLMEKAALLPSHWKLRGQQSKWILKKLAEKILPNEIIYRKKMGFGIPLAHWLRTILQPLLHDVLDHSRLATEGYLRQEYITLLIKQHTQGSYNWQYPLYNLLMCELWHREFVK